MKMRKRKSVYKIYGGPDPKNTFTAKGSFYSVLSSSKEGARKQYKRQTGNNIYNIMRL